MSLIKELEKIRNKVDNLKKLPPKEREFIGKYCFVCKIFMDDPTRFTCGNPQCNKELLEILEGRGSSGLGKLLTNFDKDTVEELEKHFRELESKSDNFDEFIEILGEELTVTEKENKLGNLFDELDADSIDAALSTVKKMKALIEEIDEKIKENKDKTSPG